MVKKTIDSFFKKRGREDIESNTNTKASQHVETFAPPEHQPSEPPRVESEEFDTSTLVRDPGLREKIMDIPISKHDEYRRAYIKAGPYQPIPQYSDEKTGLHFLTSWYKLFPDWLEYSPTKDSAFCLPCYLFTNPSTRPGSNAFMVEGFSSWKKVNGKDCAFLSHVRKHPNSSHKVALKCCYDLTNQSQHIEKIIEKQTSQQIVKNRLRLKSTIDVVKWLTFQACAFKGRDEAEESNNRGNVIELIKFLASYSDDVASVVLHNAPQNAFYHSYQIQKEIISIFSQKIQKYICEEIDGAKFCIIVNESRDESKREQMAIVLRFVDKNGFVQERFFNLVHVLDTMSAILKKEICEVLARHTFSVQNIRGQGYDGASNMRGEWSGLQALFSNECPFAYYVHCFAHRLQLALVGASKEVIPVSQFFTYLNLVVYVAGSSCRRHDNLRVAQAAEIQELLAIDELETGRELNQSRTLKRDGDTRWGSHMGSICSLINLFGAPCSVLKKIINEGTIATQRAEADGIYDRITSFEFLFILHLMRQLLGINDDLCQALQRKSQDIVNAMHLVSATTKNTQNFREEKWVTLLELVKQFSKKYGIQVPDMSAPYTLSRGRSRSQEITVEHHFRVDLFTVTVDSVLQELNHRFKEDVMELLILSLALDPRDAYRSFNVANICNLAHKFYPADFTEQEKIHLKFQLENYKLDILVHREFQNLSTISELCQVLVKTRKSIIYPHIDRLIRHVLTLPVSTATSERAFSVTKLVKTTLRNRMEDGFLASYLITYIEKDIARDFEVNDIIDAFYIMKEWRAQLQMSNFNR